MDIEERMIGPIQLGGVSQREYVRRFFSQYVDVRQRLRRGAEQFAQVKRAVGERAARLVSRLKVAHGSLAKKLSVGRPTYRFIRTGSGSRLTVPIRWHAAENAISIPRWMATEFNDFPGLAALKNVVKDGPAQEFAIKTAKRTGESIVVDLTDFGLDIKTMAKYERDSFFTEVLQGLADGTIDDVITKYNPVVAA
jgi:hypothetical protein